jgi:hypothetical protein
MEYSQIVLDIWETLGDFVIYSAGIFTAIILIISACTRKINPPKNF